MNPLTRSECATLGVVALGTATLFPAFLPNAAAHDSSLCPAVDQGQIAYEDTTAYDFAMDWSNATWDSHNTIDIFHDNWSTVTDVEWGDFSSNSDTNADYIESCGWGASDIRFNTVNVEPRIQANEHDIVRKWALHEMGHAMDLAHNDITGDVMKQGAFTVTGVTPHSHCDFHTRWGTPSGHSSGCGK